MFLVDKWPKELTEQGQMFALCLATGALKNEIMKSSGKWMEPD